MSLLTLLKSKVILHFTTGNVFCVIHLEKYCHYFYTFIYLGFYIAFNTVQVISRRVVGRADYLFYFAALRRSVGSYLPMPGGLQCTMHWFPPPVNYPSQYDPGC